MYINWWIQCNSPGKPGNGDAGKVFGKHFFVKFHVVLVAGQVRYCVSQIKWNFLSFSIFILYSPLPVLLLSFSDSLCICSNTGRVYERMWERQGKVALALHMHKGDVFLCKMGIVSLKKLKKNFICFGAYSTLGPEHWWEGWVLAGCSHVAPRCWAGLLHRGDVLRGAGSSRSSPCKPDMQKGQNRFCLEKPQEQLGERGKPGCVF